MNDRVDVLHGVNFDVLGRRETRRTTEASRCRSSR